MYAIMHKKDYSSHLNALDLKTSGFNRVSTCERKHTLKNSNDECF